LLSAGADADKAAGRPAPGSECAFNSRAGGRSGGALSFAWAGCDGRSIVADLAAACGMGGGGRRDILPVAGAAGRPRLPSSGGCLAELTAYPQPSTCTNPGQRRSQMADHAAPKKARTVRRLRMLADFRSAAHDF
jgi:hypothetical protein